MRFKTVFATLVAALALVGLSACADGDKASTEFNDADVTFAQQMISHHRQAIDMASLAADRTKNPEVLALATKIEGAQQPEIDTMSGWLRSWKKDVPKDSSMPGMDMDDESDMPGMMSEEDMSALEKASGDDFDQQFLTLMIAHHESAVEMAKAEVEAGKDGQAISLARKIQKDQTAEIATLRNLLAS